MKKQWMYKLVILFFSLWITKENVQAQKWCEPGAEWIYYGFDMGPYLGKVRYFHQKDTLIENKACQKILKQGVGGVNCTDTFNVEGGSFFSYSANDTVWFYLHNKFFPGYMFNAQVGDTHFLHHLYPDPCDSFLIFIVQNTGIEILNGDTLRTYTLQKFKDTLISNEFLSVTERIGITEHVFVPTDACIIDGPYWKLVCYDDVAVNFHNTEFNSLTCDPCNHAVSVAEHSAQNELLIYPNPVYDFLTLKVKGFSISEIEIKDITGKLLVCKRVAHFSDDNKIDVQGLNTGVYLITVRLTNNETITQKFVKN